MAEGGSYVLDASAPVGFLAAPMKAGAKAPVTSLLVTKAGEMVKAGGKKAESAAELLSSKFKSLQDEIIETELPQPKQIGALETGARVFTVAGDGLEALGRSAGQPRTLESTLERAGRTAETQAARKALKTASKVDPLLDTVGSLVSGAKAGTLSGLALTLPTGDEEMIGGAIGSGVAVGGAGGLAGRFAGKKQITQKQVENTVNEWLSSKSPEEKQNIQKLGLTPAEAGNVAVAELLGRGIIGKDKLSDVNFVYLSQDDYLKRFHPEVLVDGKAPADTPFGTRGAQSSVDGTPTVFINTGYNGARSIFHELMHGLLRFDELQDSRAELRSYLFDSKTPDGEVIKKGWFEDGDLDTQFDAYLTMLPEESSAPFLEQFNVYKDVETESGPQRVIDEEATRDRQREYIMEELEAESFANFIQQSGPTFLQQTRSISQKLLDRWFLQDNIRKTGIMKAILGRSGVEFGADGNPTGLFYRDGKPFTNSPELNKLIRDFVRAKDTVNKRMVEDDAGERPAMTIGGRQAKAGRKQIEAAIKSKDGAKVVQHFQNNDIFARDQSGKIVYDVNGVPILLGRKEIEKLQANRREQIMDKLSEVGADPNGMVQDSNGSWRGVPTNKQLRAILEVPDSIIAPGMKDTIRDIARKFKTPGQSIIIDYNPALNKSGVYDSNLSSGLRIAVPLGFNVSKSGNFYMTTLDVGAMNMKMADWAKTGQLKSWDGDTKRFYQDVYKYLENHQKDVPGETGIGVDKRNIINDFFGVTADNVNPITDARKAAEASMSSGKRSKAKASANLIRSRRFDRINRIEKNRVSKQAAGTPLPMKSQSDAYRKMQQNLMPGDRSRFMPEAEGSFNEAKNTFGTTQDLLEAGYILPDGELLDFSGRHEGADERDVAGQRYSDHREISQAGTDMQAFIDSGAVRIDARSGLIELGRKPTDTQLRQIRRIVEDKDSEVFFDLRDSESSDYNPDRPVGQSLQPEPGTDPKRVIGLIRRFYRGDDISGAVRFMPAGRARAGGEVGKNQDFYKGGQFLPSTEMPKREREKINRAASGKERIDVGYGSDKFAIPEVYKAPLVRDYSVFMNDEHLGYLEREGAAPEYIEKQREARRMWEAGDRFVDVREKPEFARFQDVARMFKAGLPIPDQVVKALEASGNANIETIKKYSSRSEGGDARFMPAALQDSVEAQTNDRPSVGVNINDGQLPFSRWIVDGKQNEDGSIQKKTIETRANPQNNALAKLSKTGERFAIISTFGPKKKQAEIIATARAGSPIMYDTLEKFRADQDKHMVKPGSDFDWDGFKVGYPIEDVRKLEKPVPVPRNVRGIQTRDLSDVRYMPAERNDRKNRVSTRLPTAAGATEDPIASTLLIGNDTIMMLPPEKQEVMAGIIANYPHIKTKKRDLPVVGDELMNMSVSNLLWLYDKVPEDVRKRSKLWYDGARKITNDWVKKYGTSNAESAGVIAVLSPQKDWFMNVSLAERVIDAYKNKQDVAVNQDMIAKASEITQFSKDELIMKVIRSMKNKKYADLDPLEKAYFMRLYDQTYRSQSFPVISPEGKMLDVKMNDNGTVGKVIHASSPAYMKAISILENPTKENISTQLGGQHKVRNFNNNILLPKLATEDVTIDTHAVAAALLKPLSAKSIEVGHNFGSGVPNSSITGGKGTYGIYADAYRKAAEQRGVMPREMQSITWEAVRGLFPQRMKNKKNNKIVDDIWGEYNRGKISLDEARDKISDAFGGIRNPSWYGRDK